MKLRLDTDKKEEEEIITLKLEQCLTEVVLKAYTKEGTVKNLIVFNENGTVRLPSRANIGNFRFDEYGYLMVYNDGLYRSHLPSLDINTEDRL